MAERAQEKEEAEEEGAQEPGGESSGTVLLALVVNAIVTLAKFGAGAVGGSAVMLSEAAHSVADTMNEVFLFASLKRSRKPPDRQHPFGYGKERFFWALIAAVGIFVAGAGFSLLEAMKAFSESPKSADKGYLVDYIVFGFAAAVETVSWVRAYRQTRSEAEQAGRNLRQHVRLSPDPSVKTVASEDTVAVIGDVLGLGATGVQQLTGQPLWDGVASLMIMGMLIFVAFALARDNKDLLIGEAVEEKQEDEVLDIISSQSGIKEVFDLLTMRMGTDSVLVATRVDLADDLDGGQVEELAEQIAQRIREKVPDVTDVFVDPSRRSADSEDQRGDSPARATTVLSLDGEGFYHRLGCRTVEAPSSAQEITRLEARRSGRQPCEKCDP